MRKLAEVLKSYVEPHCHRVEIAGSIRRLKRDPKDIELCALVKPPEPEKVDEDLFGDPIYSGKNMPTPAMQILLDNASEVTRQGDKMCSIVIDNTKVDYFQCWDPNAWGLLFWIRTGPSEYVRHHFTEWKKRGGTSEDLVLRLRGKRIDCPDEQAVFRAMRIPVQPPFDRVGPQ